jgi:GT2 family glycosyltransferase
LTLLQRDRSELRSVAHQRPNVRGKFLFAGEEKLYLRGVTYGGFPPDANGDEFPSPEIVRADFAGMAANGMNAVRTYTAPPAWLLDLALQEGLRVMVGLPWEQHVALLSNSRLERSIAGRVRAAVHACVEHPAVLCYVIGNEIPAAVVRWHGRRRIERFLKQLVAIVKSEDPEALVTYVNYPSTEYLELPFLDFVSFNVYLEAQETLDAYLARLQNLAGDRPLILAEIGLDSRRNGEDGQAASLEWQVRTAFAAGCAGAFVFAWTDEWHRGGYDIEDWDFGLTTRDRQAKPALVSVRAAFGEVPFPATTCWPRISVVVCSYNGERTIRDCCEGLMRLEYPNVEVIVVNDGSTDATPAIAGEYPFRLVTTENRGLSGARNTGLQAATGEIVAYTDDDARPDPHWLQYLAMTFMSGDYAGVGGPNIAPAGDGPIADCVANAPGGPVHVLLSDRVAEHIPGCNMAFRRERLLAIDGFDPRYRAAGDDVDVCWRLQERGWILGFSPAAMVWHHRRNSVRTYWKQQQGYGKAEALLEEKWPDKYNAIGHLTWTGRLYGKGLTRMLGSRGRIYHGVWGAAPFQSLYEPAPSLLRSLPLMPEWYLVIAALAALSALGLSWRPLLIGLPLLVPAIAAPLLQALMSASHANFPSKPRSGAARLRRTALTAALHLLQPLARLRGRIRYGLTPWRRRGRHRFSLPLRRSFAIWSERWRAPASWLESIEDGLRAGDAVVRRGGIFDRWDLEIRGGMLGTARLRMLVEEHGAGRQLARFSLWPHWSFRIVAAVGICFALAIAAAPAWPAAAVMGFVALLLLVRALLESAAAIAAVRSIEDLHGTPGASPAREAGA